MTRLIGTPGNLALRVDPTWAGQGDEWLSTESASRLVGGVTPRWVRMQIETGRLRARALLTGRRATYRIRRDDLDEFLSAFVVEDVRDINGSRFPRLAESVDPPSGSVSVERRGRSGRDRLQRDRLLGRA